MALRLRRGTNAQRQTITPVEGELVFTTDTKQLFVGDGTTVGGNSVSAPVTSVNGQTGTVSLTTNEVSEGNGNLYFTNERAQDASASMLTGGTHTGIGFTYVDNGASAGTINAALNDTYLTEVAQDAINTSLTAGSHSNITFSYNDSTGALSLSATSDTFKNISTSAVYISSFTKGSGYTRHPSVALSRAVGDTTGDPSTSRVLAYLVPSAIQTIQIVNGGSGYTTAPTITVVPDGDEDTAVTAVATCTVSGGIINSVTLKFEGHYTRTPTVTVTPTNGGAGAILRAFLYPTPISRYLVDRPGTAWQLAPVVTVTTDPFDTPTSVSTVTASLSPILVASGSNSTLQLASANDRLEITTTNAGGVQRIFFNPRNIGEIASETKGALAYYGSTGNVLVGARGINYLESAGTFQIGSDVQNVEGVLRIIRNAYSTGTSVASIEQYQSTSTEAIPFSFARARGTQSTPLAVQNQDRLGKLLWGGYDGTRFVYGASMQSRVENTFTANSNKMPMNLEFTTYDGVESAPSRVLTLAGKDKTATFNGAVVLKNHTTATRDALTNVAFGSIIYNTTTNKFQGYQNTGGVTPGWVDLS